MGTHFVGIGGYGMSALAQLLHARGETVSGSDARPSSRTRRLEGLGIPVFYGHRPEQIGSARRVVYSTDVPPDNPELAAARSRGRQILHRSELLALLLEGPTVILVSGTHGKTTTTTMIGTILAALGRNPTVLVGGEVDAFGGTARVGDPGLMVVEADESDGSFLRFRGDVAVATNLEAEHLEHYGGDFSRLQQAFADFLGRAPRSVLSAADAELRRLLPALPTALPVGEAGRGLWAEEVTAGSGGIAFRVVTADGERVPCRLPVPGLHNVQNALLALAAVRDLGVDLTGAAGALAGFRNAHRRLEVRGSGGGVTVIDDYAHHPTEIRATLAAARTLGSGRLLAAFQPQRYSRTARLFAEFATAFGEADRVYLTEIYSPPGEQPLPGVSGEALARRVAENEYGKPIRFAADRDTLLRYLADDARAGDLVLLMGAGDIGLWAPDLLERLARSGTC